MFRKIRPEDEQVSGVFYLIWFTVIWYGALLQALLRGSMTLEASLLFLIAGLMPVIFAVNKGYTVFKIRGMRRVVIEKNDYVTGHVVGVESGYYYVTTRSDRLQRHLQYHMIVEFVPKGGEQPIRIRSQQYSRPIHKYLASNEVKVYQGENRWHYVIDDLQTKWLPSEPDFELETVPVERIGDVIPDVILRGFTIVICLLFLYEIFF